MPEFEEALPHRTQVITDTPESDCLWHSGGFEPEHGVQAICELIRDFVPSLGFDPVTDVQVLCPMTRGVVGTRNLNQVLQQLLNPPTPEKPQINRGGDILRVGDSLRDASRTGDSTQE